VGGQHYLARKIAYAFVTLIFVLTFNFFLFRVLPGDPVGILARSERLTAADVAQLRSQYGLDQPIPRQYVTYFENTVQGRLGVSLRSGEQVSSLIAGRVWPTILLVGLGTILSTIVGVTVGIRGAWTRGSRFDRNTLYGALVFYAMPEGWLGMLLLILFAGTLHWFPAGGYASADSVGFHRILDIANHLILPCLTLTLGYIGSYSIIMRSSLLEVMNEDFVLTARAKGASDGVVRRHHAVPNAILPTATLIFLSFGYVLGGAIVIETVFSWPGIGLLTYDAIRQLDYPVIQAVFLLSSATVILATLLTDIMYGYLDPRVRAS
jgi:peptide/nickel transport system permease protein